MKRRLAAAATVLTMLTPKIYDEIEDLFDEDPATLFSWEFMLALLAAPVAFFILGSPNR